MTEDVDTELTAVPDVVLECWMKQDSGSGLTRVRVTGTKYELDNLLIRFQQIINANRYTYKSTYP